MSSAFWGFAGDVCSAIYTNVDTLGAHSFSENLWSESGAALNKAWLSGSMPGTSGETQAAIDVSKISSDKVQGAKDIQNIITNDFQNLGQWCSELVNLMLQKLGACWDGGQGSSSPLQQSAITNEGSAVSAQSQLETSPFDSMVKMVNSLVQNDASATSPMSNAGDAYTGVLTSLASLLSSISA